MDSGRDTPKGWVSPFGHPRINDRSHLPAAFRSVPRPSSPLGAKASTECPSLTPYSHHRPRTGPNHAPHCQVSDGSARIIPGDAVKSCPGRCAPLTHTTDHLHHVKEHAAPQATRLPLEDRGPPMRNETALEVSPPHRAAHRASTINTPKDKGRRPRDAEPRGNAAQAASRASGRSLFAAPAATGNGDGRIRTDDPLLAKQVLSH